MIYPPSFKLAELRVNSSLFNVVNESSFENSQLIGRYKEMSPGESYDIPPYIIL